MRETTARYGCPTGPLAVELGRRTGSGLDLALTLVGAYRGMSLLSNALRDPEIMTR